MSKPVYVFRCEDCQQFSNGQDLICINCGASAKRRTEVTVVNDGAPTGASDTQFVKGFRKGQEMGIQQFSNEVDNLVNRVDQLTAHVEMVTKAVEIIEEEVKDLIGDPLPCIDCGDLVERATWKEELGFCVPCQHYYFDQGIER